MINDAREAGGSGVSPAAEARKLLSLSCPVILSQVGLMLLTTTDLIMVGHVSEEALASASLGHIWANGVRLLGLGLVLGMDPIVSQAHGARNARRLGLALQRGLLLSVLISLPLASLWALTSTVLMALGQDPQLSAEAHDYVLVQIPSLLPFLVWTTFRQHLGGRGIMRPAMWVTFQTVVVNVACNWVLIYGHLGMPRLELVGAGIATTISQYFMLGSLLFIFWRHRLHRGAWRGWDAAALSIRELAEILGHGSPIAIQFMLEFWAFHITTLMAGWLGNDELAAHSIVLNLVSVSFMVPLGISIGAVTRVGNLTGRGDRPSARRATHVALLSGAAAMFLFSTVFMTLRWQLPLIYTTESTVIGLCASILPIAAVFQLFDGTQVIGGGVLRGMGRTRAIPVFHFLGFYVLALPLAWWLAFQRAHGLTGLWWGLCLGLASTALCLVGWIRWILSRGSNLPPDPVAAE